MGDERWLQRVEQEETETLTAKAYHTPLSLTLSSSSLSSLSIYTLSLSNPLQSVQLSSHTTLSLSSLGCDVSVRKKKDRVVGRVEEDKIFLAVQWTKLQGGFNLPVCANREAEAEERQSHHSFIHPPLLSLSLCLPSHACSRMVCTHVLSLSLSLVLLPRLSPPLLTSLWPLVWSLVGSSSSRAGDHGAR